MNGGYNYLIARQGSDKVYYKTEVLDVRNLGNIHMQWEWQPDPYIATRFSWATARIVVVPGDGQWILSIEDASRAASPFVMEGVDFSKYEVFKGVKVPVDAATYNRFFKNVFDQLKGAAMKTELPQEPTQRMITAGANMAKGVTGQVTNECVAINVYRAMTEAYKGEVIAAKEQADEHTAAEKARLEKYRVRDQVEAALILLDRADKALQAISSTWNRRYFGEAYHFFESWLRDTPMSPERRNQALEGTFDFNISVTISKP